VVEDYNKIKTFQLRLRAYMKTVVIQRNRMHPSKMKLKKCFKIINYGILSSIIKLRIVVTYVACP
jgi:hypothetical protein